LLNPFDPLLIVRDPYNSRIIKELYYSFQKSILEHVSFSMVNNPRHNTFDLSIPLELDVDVMLGSRCPCNIDHIIGEYFN